MILFMLAAWQAWWWWFHRRVLLTAWFLVPAALSGVAAIVAMEAGWVVTEVGRQPWIVYKVLLVSQAVTPVERGDRDAGGDARPLRDPDAGLDRRPDDHVTTVAAGNARRRGGRAGAVRPLADRGPPCRCPPRRVGRAVNPSADTIAVAAILFVVIAAYALFGGADFGGGIWDLLAGGAERGEAPRELIDESITPVWEANHVWLVFILVLLWTAFPPAFAAIMTALFVPLSLSLLGIVLRGVGFAFRHTAQRLPTQRLTGAVVRLRVADHAVLHGHGRRGGRHRAGAGAPRWQRPGRVDVSHRHPHRVPVRRRLRLHQRGVPRPRGRPARAAGPDALLLTARDRRRGGHRRAGRRHVRRAVEQHALRLPPPDRHRPAAGGDLDRRRDRGACHALAALAPPRGAARDGRDRGGDRGVGLGPGPVPLPVPHLAVAGGRAPRPRGLCYRNSSSRASRCCWWRPASPCSTSCSNGAC